MTTHEKYNIMIDILGYLNKQILIDSLQKQNVHFDRVEIFSGPCRITFYVTGIQEFIIVPMKEIKGPAISSPDLAILGFCKKYDLSTSVLTKVKIQNEEYYIYIQPEKIVPVNTILQTLLPDIIKSHVWDKTMLWEEYTCNWPRPLRNIMCILDGKLLDIKYYHLSSNNFTFGHKFISNKPISVNSWEEYLNVLSDNFVILSRIERTTMIKDQASKVLNTLNLKNHIDQDILSEIASNVEYPTLAVGRIPEKYMSLPPEILTTVMFVHQKYFATYDKTGNLAPYFLFVYNKIEDIDNKILHGNEKVLKARLEDAQFLYKKDLEVSLEDRYKKLKSYSFHRLLGSMQEKSERLVSLSKILYPNDFDLLIAAKFCKCDLVGDVVSDLATLQGTIGYYYLLNAGYSKKIANAVLHHYEPLSAYSKVPEGLSSKLAFIDKVDSLVGLYIAGERATGNKDTYGLRRLALGIIRLIDGSNITSNISNVIMDTMNLYGIDQVKKDILLPEILNFIKLRHKYLLSADFGDHFIDSVLHSFDYSIESSKGKLEAVKAFCDYSNYPFILQVFKRINNFVKSTSNTFSENFQNEVCLPEEQLVEKAIKNYYMKFEMDTNNYCNLLCELYDLALSINTLMDNVRITDNPISYNLLLSSLKCFSRIIAFEYLQNLS